MLQDQSNGVILHSRRNRSKCVCNIFFFLLSFSMMRRMRMKISSSFMKTPCRSSGKLALLSSSRYFFVNSLKNNSNAYKKCENKCEIQLLFAVTGEKLIELFVAYRRCMRLNASNPLASFALVVLKQVQQNSSALCKNRTNSRLL